MPERSERLAESLRRVDVQEGRPGEPVGNLGDRLLDAGFRC